MKFSKKFPFTFYLNLFDLLSTWYIQFLEVEGGVLTTGREFLILNAQEDCYLKIQCNPEEGGDCAKPTIFRWHDVIDVSQLINFVCQLLQNYEMSTDDFGVQPPIVCENAESLKSDPSLFVWRYNVRPEFVENRSPGSR